MTGSLQLREYPGEIVRLSCSKCGRAGQYRKQTLIERFGADMRLPDLREEIADCSRRVSGTTAAWFVTLIYCLITVASLVPKPYRHWMAGIGRAAVADAQWAALEFATRSPVHFKKLGPILDPNS
jgi:hypothetical protein